MTPHTSSIRKRLLIWISIPILALSALIILLAFTFSWIEIGEVYDSHLAQTSKTLFQMTKHGISEEKDLKIMLGGSNSTSQNYENKMAFRVLQGDRIILQSEKAKSFDTIRAPLGFSDQNINGKPWRFFVFTDEETNMRMEAGERYAIRYELIYQLVISLVIPMVFLIVSLLVIVWIGVRKSLKPLTALSATVDARDTDDLSGIATGIVPAEAMPLVHALNRLFARITDSFRKEREFTDHAAHELRTPMAAMKTQTQVLMKKAATIPECREGLENLNAIIDRSTHLLEQLLSMARLQNERLPLSDTNLSECVQDAVSEMKMRAAEKHQRLDLSIAEDVHIKGHGDSLYILIRNLLDNAIKYTPDSGAVSVVLWPNGTLQISDTGTGIQDTDKDRVLKRFVRADKSGQSGSGLGLSIVQWIVNAHGARLSMKDNPPRGLIAEIKFAA